MRRIFLALILIFSVAAIAVSENGKLKPYTLAGIQHGEMAAVQERVSKLLTANGFSIVGTYSPMQVDTLSVICVTHSLLLKDAEYVGGLHVMAAVLRIGLHKTDNGIVVSYTTPDYWGNAYYRKEFFKVEDDYKTLDKLFRTALDSLNKPVFSTFGSKKGLSINKLRKYHYKIMMPYFDDVIVLQDAVPYEEAVKRIEDRAKENSDAAIVYTVKFPKLKMALFGIALKGDNGEKKFLPKIDFSYPLHTPFLPYEMLVMKDRTVMLHGKYRIALSFPDLSMGTFMKIMSTPGDIKKTMQQLVKNEE